MFKELQNQIFEWNWKFVLTIQIKFLSIISFKSPQTIPVLRNKCTHTHNTHTHTHTKHTHTLSLIPKWWSNTLKKRDLIGKGERKKKNLVNIHTIIPNFFHHNANLIFKTDFLNKKTMPLWNDTAQRICQIQLEWDWLNKIFWTLRASTLTPK